MPYFGPFDLGGTFGGEELNNLRQSVGQRFPGMTGFTTYANPQGNGTNAIGFTSPGQILFQGQPPSTLNGLFASNVPLSGGVGQAVQPETLSARNAGVGTAGPSAIGPSMTSLSFPGEQQSAVTQGQGGGDVGASVAAGQGGFEIGRASCRERV